MINSEMLSARRKLKTGHNEAPVQPGNNPQIPPELIKTVDVFFDKVSGRKDLKELLRKLSK